MTLQSTHVATGPRRRRISVGDYHRMVEAGVLRSDERVELIEGELLEMSPHGSPHASILSLLNQALVRQVSDAWTVRPQLPLTIEPDSEPEPDLAVVRTEEHGYWREHPRTAALLVEVADSSLVLDRDKARLHARAGVEAYWLVNVSEGFVEVYRDPDPAAGRYRTMETRSPGETLRFEAIGGAEIAVGDLFR